LLLSTLWLSEFEFQLAIVRTIKFSYDHFFSDTSLGVRYLNIEVTANYCVCAALVQSLSLRRSSAKVSRSRSLNSVSKSSSAKTTRSSLRSVKYASGSVQRRGLSRVDYAYKRTVWNLLYTGFIKKEPKSNSAYFDNHKFKLHENHSKYTRELLYIVIMN